MDFFEIERVGYYNKFLENLNDRGVYTLAVDIECEFNMHHYGEHLALVQIYDGLNCYIIDPLKSGNIAIVKRLFEDKNLLKVMYSCSSDISLLFNVYNIKTKSFLDLQLAVDLLNFQKKGLGSVLNEVLKVDENNKSKFQKMDWLRRPLSASAIDYALGDVFFLLDLRDELFKSLLKEDLLDVFFHKNLLMVYSSGSKNRLEKHQKAKGYKKLKKEEKARFKELYYIRDRYAKIADKPPHYIFGNGILIDFAKNKNISRDRIYKAIMRSLKNRDKFFDELMSVK